MTAEHPWEQETTQQERHASTLGLALTLAALTALGAGIVYSRIKERRLSRPERVRLKFYRYLRERGHLES
ncbi:MAG: hypothetical protein M3Z66_21420 [Chloroflexota bacterium]|nr:hypothetical protein [Chloroflexota bacterium]